MEKQIIYLETNKHQDNINRNLGFLIHEYAHLFSNFEFAFTKESPQKTIEEGMADVFADLVINHYLDKYKKVELDGKKIRIDKPYVTYSGYNFENAWSRTILAGLVSTNKDFEAVGEYLLGDKLKFAEMVFGKEITKTKEITFFGMPIINTSKFELYNSPKLDFSNIDKNSIYYNRNYILPLFQIQNKIKNQKNIMNRSSYSAIYIADKYFEGRKFYEIPKEELEEFIDLLHTQITPGDNSSSTIVNISEYKNNEINNLSEEEIKTSSFEILDAIPVLWEKDKPLKAGTTLENVIKLAIEEEIRKIKNGQPIELTRQKKDLIAIRYQELFSLKNESNMYILDYINDFCFESEQAESKYENNTQDLLNSAIIKNIARQNGVPEKKSIAIDEITELQTVHDRDMGINI